MRRLAVTPTNASLGFLDPARYFAPRCRRPACLGRQADQGDPASFRPLRDSRQRPCHRCIFHSTHAGRADDAGGDRSASGPSADDALLPSCGPGDCARALLPPRRPAVADAIRGLAGKYSSVLLSNHGPVVAGDSLEAAVLRRRNWKRPQSSTCCCATSSRYLSSQQVADLPKPSASTAVARRP